MPRPSSDHRAGTVPGTIDYEALSRLPDAHHGFKARQPPHFVGALRLHPRSIRVCGLSHPLFRSSRIASAARCLTSSRCRPGSSGRDTAARPVGRSSGISGAIAATRIGCLPTGRRSRPTRVDRRAPIPLSHGLTVHAPIRPRCQGRGLLNADGALAIRILDQLVDRWWCRAPQRGTRAAAQVTNCGLRPAAVRAVRPRQELATR
jgi:hypothetical protein